MNPTLHAKICDTSSLPSLPAAALRVLQLTQDDKLALDELAGTIASDPALSSKVLRAVNSSVYGLPHKVSSVQQAVALLGIHTVRTLVLGFSLSTSLKANSNSTGFDYLAYWRRSMYAATAARITAERVLAAKIEECFVAALLMDFGCLLLDNLMGHEYGSVCVRARQHTDLLMLEAHAMGMTHAEAGGLLAEHWHLPDVLRVPIASHHGADAVEDPALRKVTQVVSLAGRIADVFIGSSAAEPISAVRESFRTLYGINEIQCDGLLCQIGMKTGELAPLFDVKLNEAADYTDIREKASKRLLELSLAQQESDAAPSNKRRANRVRRDGAMSITPCSHGILGQPVQVRLKDLSAMGLGVTHSAPIPIGSQFLIQLAQGKGEVKTLLYKVVRCDTSSATGVSCIGAELISILKPAGPNDLPQAVARAVPAA
jgi:two-component system, cell cycle response regulator